MRVNGWNLRTISSKIILTRGPIRAYWSKWLKAGPCYVCAYHFFLIFFRRWHMCWFWFSLRKWITQFRNNTTQLQKYLMRCWSPTKYRDLLRFLSSQIKRMWLRSVIVFTVFAASLVVFCLLIPAAIFMAVEDWTYRDSFYYSFITLTTIGFGDFVVGKHITILKVYSLPCMR